MDVLQSCRTSAPFRFRPSLCSIAFAAGLLLLPAVASADQDDLERAQESFDDGARYYEAEDYHSAIVEFRRANSIHPHPIFSYNIARANRELKRPERALDAALDADERRDELPEDTAAANSAMIAAYQTVLTGHDGVETIAERTVDEAPDPEPPSRWGGFGWAGAAMLVSGAGALTGAALIDRQIVGGVEELKDQRDAGEIGSGEFNTERDRLAGRQGAGLALLWSGVALTTVGTSLVVWELATVSEPSDNVAIGPRIDGPGINALVRW